LRFEKVNASVGNVYLCKGTWKVIKGTVVGMENHSLP